MEFWRYSALGNDYLVIDPAQTAVGMTAAAVRRICDRHLGVGSDGILFGPDDARKAAPLVRIFNPDGGEAEKSGNGLRIFARHLVDRGHRPLGVPFQIMTKGGLVRATVADPSTRIEVDMGRATFVSTEIPVAGAAREVVGERLSVGGAELTMVCVSIGNPHCVIPVATATEGEARRLGPQVECHPLFPNRINMQLLQVLDRSSIRIAIWERGAGYTLASGSSSCAAVAAAHRLGLVDRSVRVHMPGGNLAVEIGEDGSLRQAGPVDAICRGELADEFAAALRAG